MLMKSPMIDPTTAMTEYLKRYKILIFRFLMPIAFMTPISRKSSPIEKLMENRSIRNDTIMRQILKMTTTNATIRFITYAILIVDIGEE